MEEELGCVEECEELLLQGLVHCPQSDSILLKAVKLQEKLGNMRMARSLLSRMKLIPVERAWRVILEGALLETRAGNMTVARKVFKYLVKSVPWYGPIYCDMCAVHERECDWLRAEKIVACGLQNIPRYGPLWLCAMRVCERKFMLPAFGKPLPDAAQLVCNQTRQIATQALQLMGSKELVWKLLMHASQSEARAGNVSSWRSATTSASLSAPDNLRWKVWNAAAKMELACGDAALCLPLLERALQVKHATHLHF
jgi:la-related protein 1